MMLRFTKSLISFVLFTIFSFTVNGQGIITFEFYVDQNCDGTKQAGEPFTTMPDLPSLFDVTNGVSLPLAPTLAGNTWSYTSLPDGDYELTWANPSGPLADPWILSSPASGIAAITIAGGNPTVVRAAYFQQTRLEHFAWDDLNGNGLQDGGEPGITGLTITLSGNDFCGNPPATTVATDLGGGNYEFLNVNPSAAGGYTLNFSLPAGFERSSKDEGGNDNTDSDPIVASGNISVIVLNDANTSNNENTTVDAGYFVNSVISDFVWEDINGNGVQDGEPGIDGVTVTLSGTDGAGNAVNIVDITAGGGLYEFDMVPPGTNYKVDFTLPTANHFFTAQDLGGDDNLDSDANPANGEVINIMVESGDAPRTDIDAGMYVGSEISNFVWEDLNGDGDQDGGEPGFAGITVAISGNTGAGVPIARPNQVTPGSGLYLFDDLPPGTYTITFSGLPALHFWTDPDQAGGDDDLDSDPDKITGAAPPQLIESGDVVTNRQSRMG
jgi:hypothetical protein